MSPLAKIAQPGDARKTAGIPGSPDPSNPVGRAAGSVLPEDASAEPTSSPNAKTELIDWAFEEFHRRVKKGEDPDVQEWCARFPTCQSALLGLLQTEQFVDDHIDYLDTPIQERTDIRWPRKGERRGGFTIVRELGRGGFSRVYLAREAATGNRPVVVKFSSRGRREARTLGRITHPHVVPIHSAHRDKITGLTMVCMPYLGCATLEHVLDHLRPTGAAALPRKASILLDVVRGCAQPEDTAGAVPAARLQHGSYAEGVLHLVMQLAQTLAYLHQRGICHRDLKPSNVLLDSSGKPLLLDFNLAASKRKIIPIGGTLRYLAPEHLRALEERRKAAPDEHADLFALGVMAYELLCGEHPCGPLPADLEGRPLVELLVSRLTAGFRSFRAICPELEAPVALVLDRCLAVNPADRPTAAELATTCARQFSPLRRVRRRLAARPRLAWSFVAMLLVVITVGTFAWAMTPPFHARAYRLGMQAYQQGDFDAAENHFDDAFRADRDNPRYRFARGCARLQQSKLHPEDKEKLTQILEDLVSDDSPSAALPTLGVHAYIQTRRQKAYDAIGLYSQILSSGNLSDTALNNRAYSYLVVGDFDAAKADLDLAAQGDLRCQAVFYNRAHLALYLRSRDAKHRISRQAIDDIELAVRLGPCTSALLFDAALLYTQAASDEEQRTPLCLDAPIVTAIHLHERQVKVERAIHYLGRAIAGGRIVDLKKNSIFHRTLSTHRAFESLRNMQPPSPSPEPELRLLDPVSLSDS